MEYDYLKLKNLRLMDSRVEPSETKRIQALFQHEKSLKNVYITVSSNGSDMTDLTIILSERGFVYRNTPKFTSDDSVICFTWKQETSADDAKKIGKLSNYDYKEAIRTAKNCSMMSMSRWRIKIQFRKI